MLGNLDRPAELVRIAARSAAEGNAAVRLEVLHHGPQERSDALSSSGVIGDTMGENEDVPAAPLIDPPTRGEGGRPSGVNFHYSRGSESGLVIPREQFFFSTLGCRTEVTTWPVVRRDASEAAVFDTGQLRGSRPGRWYVGTAVPNPGFLYEHAESVEIMLSHRRRGWVPSLRDSLFLTVAMRTLAHCAADIAKAPILFLQTPVAPVSEASGDGSREAGRPANGNAIRLSVGVGKGDARARIALLEAVDNFASEWGLSLHVGDRRVRRIRGEWSQVRMGDPEGYVDQRDSRFAAVPDEAPARIVLATVIGPARVGSSLAVAALLERSGIGILSAAITSLSEMAIVSLMLPVSPLVDESSVQGAGGGVKSAEKGIPQLRKLCSVIPPDGREPDASHVDMRPAVGYQLLRSEPYDIRTVPEPFDRHVGPYPLWAAWDLPDGTLNQGQVLGLLLRFLRSQHPQVEVAYARTRHVDEGRMRGRAKISVLLARAARLEDVPMTLRGLADRAEEYVRASLAANEFDPEACRLRVTARERWLGRWHLPV